MRTKVPRTVQSIHELALDDDAGEADVHVLLLGLRWAHYKSRRAPLQEPWKSTAGVARASCRQSQSVGEL